MARFHHVNVGVPPGGVEAQAAFLVGVLDYREVRQRDARPGASDVWFESADGVQVHLSEDPDHRPAARAHFALDFDGGLDDVLSRLSDAGCAHDCYELGSLRIVNCLDPAGNRWELRGQASADG